MGIELAASVPTKSTVSCPVVCLRLWLTDKRHMAVLQTGGAGQSFAGLGAAAG